MHRKKSGIILGGAAVIAALATAQPAVANAQGVADTITVQVKVPLSDNSDAPDSSKPDEGSRVREGGIQYPQPDPGNADDDRDNGNHFP
ncbi:hypothetical protein DFR68_111226 [Nocardia mexicana]|uniref:Uncharacterized protein n=1 Tax=Nocardia mexicana TaxID=279262 RepID=A0A370GRZ0_9NOCA|nr:hypothetical protein DFR68_111226 [Nocardia mexicana]